MKALNFSQIVAFFILLFGINLLSAQTATLTFTGSNSDNQHVKLSRVEISNLNQNWVQTIYYPDTILMLGSTGIDDLAEKGEFRLSQNTPNPFYGSTNFNLQLPEGERVQLNVFDLNGRRITFYENTLPAGVHNFQLLLSSVQAYILTAETQAHHASIKLVNSGPGSLNAIQYVGNREAPLTFVLSSNKSNCSHPFSWGDDMLYVGFAMINGIEYESQHIQQQQFGSQTITFVFEVQEPIDGQACIATPTVSDFDGNVYNTVQIGNQCWMRENLKTTHYFDGEAIALGTVSDTSSAYRYYPNNNSAYVNTYGYLYNWKAAMKSSSCSDAAPSGVQGACPTGYHIPSDNEWNQLFSYVESMSSYQCGEAEENIAKALASTNNWSGSVAPCAIGNDLSINNVTGFSALPAGSFVSDSYGNDVGARLFLWSTSESSAEKANYQFFFYNNANITTGNKNKSSAFSVRCLRDPESLPTITTDTITDIRCYTANLSSTVVSDGGYPVTARGICWSTEPYPTLEGEHTTDGNGTGTFSSIMTELTENTTYYVRSYATNYFGTSYGNSLCVVTHYLSQAAVVTDSISELHAGSVTIHSTVTFDGYDTIIYRGVCWSTEPNPTITDEYTSDSIGTGSFCSLLSGLSNSTRYYVRAYAFNSLGITYGNEISFTTTPVQYIFTNQDITIIPDGPECECSHNIDLEVEGFGSTTIITNHNDILYLRLKLEHSYIGDLYIRLTCPNGQTAAILKSLRNLNNCGEVISSDDIGWNATSGSQNQSAFFGIANENDDIYRCDPIRNPIGIPQNYCWSQNDNTNYGLEYANGAGYIYENVNIQNNIVKSSDALSFTNFYHPDQSFDRLIGCPIDGTWNIHITDSYTVDNGWIAAAEIAFADHLATHIVNTDTVMNISQHSATVAGEVLDDLGYPITSRGVCWGTAPHPTINGNHIDTTGGIGAFSVNISGLEAGTIYFVRMYVTNSNGTEYGNQIKFSTSMFGEGHSCYNLETVSDYDNNIYHTVQIGNQCWLKENLKTRHYSNGNEIPVGNSSSSSTPYCYYPNNDLGNVSDFGYLYNWAAVMNGATSSNTTPSGVQGICPAGWHIPSDAEWESLINYVSSNSDYLCDSSIAKALASTTYWNATTSDCSVGNLPEYNNATGFSALPAGFYGSENSGIGNNCYFWSCTDSINNLAYCRFLLYNDENTGRMDNDKANGYSVRCINDNSGTTTSTASVITHNVYNITRNTAYCTGIISSNGGSAVTERGVCWSTEPNPTISDKHTSTGNNTGTFNSYLSPLKGNTTYYVRAYATNSIGTEYGNELSFTTLPLYCPNTPTVTDYDNNVYETVQIGTQCWMASNLRTTHYSDGTSIPETDSGWVSTPYCYANWSGHIYGNLYNYPAVMHGAASSITFPSGVQGICPTGWHVPSEIEWTTLFTYMNSQDYFICDNEGGNIAKALASPFGWNQEYWHYCSPGYNPGDNNISGFSAIPIGLYSDFHKNAGKIAYFWTSTSGICYYIDVWFPYVTRFPQEAEAGLAVRCVQD